MKSLKTRWSVGLGSLALCMSLFIAIFTSVLSVKAAEEQIYAFSSFLENKTFYYELRGGDIDFVSGYFRNSPVIQPTGSVSFSYFYISYAFSLEPFIFYQSSNLSNLGSAEKSSSLSVNGTTVYYAQLGISGSVTTYKPEDFDFYGGLYNLKEIRTDFSDVNEMNKYITNVFLQKYAEEFVTNDGIDWEDFLHPDDSNISGLGGGDIQDLEAFISDYVLFCSWSGLGGSIPGASTKSFISPTLIFADKDDPENTDLIRQLKYYENFWVSDYSLEINFRSLLEKNEFLYGVRLTPYYYKDDNDINSLVQGSSTTIYFDINGDWDEDKNGPSHGGSSNPPDSSRRFSLTGIYVETTPFSQQIIRWAGTTIDNELSYVPDKNTKVKAYVEWIDADGNYIYEEYENSSTIGKGYLAVYIKPIQTESKNSELSWTGRIRLEPAYTVNNVTYHGKYSYVDFDNELITGGDLGDGSSSDFESILPSDDPISNHFSMSDVADYAELGLGFLSGLLDLMGSFPKLVAAIFSFMPSIYIEAIGAFILIIFIARILGR